MYEIDKIDNYAQRILKRHLLQWEDSLDWSNEEYNKAIKAGKPVKNEITYINKAIENIIKLEEALILLED